VRLDVLGAPETLDAAGGERQPVETLHRYAWAYDERALDVLGSVFTADAVFDGVIDDRDLVGPVRGRQQIVEWLEQAMLGQGDQRRHCIVNTLTLSRSVSAAALQCYLVLTAAQDREVRLVTTGFYRAQLVRSDAGSWLIERLHAGFDAPF
jgi:hypothetical protein